MSIDVTYRCENCHKKYNRNKSILLCPFCGSDFVVEQPHALFKQPPLSQAEIYGRQKGIPNDPFYPDPDFVDFPTLPHSSGRPDFNPNPNFTGGDFFLPSHARNPLQIYPRNPYTGSSRPPELVMRDPGNFGDLDAHFAGRVNPEIPPYLQERRDNTDGLRVPHKECCVNCGKILSNTDDIITLPCGHQGHASCLKRADCPICLSLYS
ncbi:hypothetical protein EIN_284730 [Entamoeba invadens IP1]|uniref:RING-type domain-containing protein n=1 Tax=Entamoeba invadens IP1 TaxID=370355 RepID=L7FKF5_ENTIV|nr:hypothetical protein EIN_284730 [Entamoeba invadens IP1]ELP84887.1 hypothetical protein EIN_284730 [Entamoeba invadens IP1]|eukprot:XP_004184233.1 hypothetical protein EIN_284730 [Entamoeba invadens IP1]